MLIKCTECGKEISEQAYACPNCGCPNKPLPQHGDSNAILHSTNTPLPSGAREAASAVGKHIGKLLILFLSIILLGALFAFVTRIGQTNIEARIFVNLFLPAFWIPIINLIHKLYGPKGRKIAFVVFLVMVSIGLLGEYGTLQKARVFSYITPSQIGWALLAKLFGILWVIGVLNGERNTKPVRESDANSSGGSHDK